MHTKPSQLKFLAVLLPVVGVIPATAEAQHVHGVVELGIVVENDTVAISLTAPLSDVVGFEHEPKNDEQAKLIEQAATMLADPDAMFGLAKSVSCEVANKTVDGPGYVLKHLGQAGEKQGGHDDHDHDAHHHEHDSDHEEHAEVVASYEWQCGDVSALDSVDLRFTEKFASVETIKIQILTAAGAQVLTAEGRAGSVSLLSP